jgi:hypothetical protein
MQSRYFVPKAKVFISEPNKFSYLLICKPLLVEKASRKSTLMAAAECARAHPGVGRAVQEVLKFALSPFIARLGSCIRCTCSELDESMFEIS